MCWNIVNAFRIHVYVYAWVARVPTNYGQILFYTCAQFVPLRSQLLLADTLLYIL